MAGLLFVLKFLGGLCVVWYLGFLITLIITLDFDQLHPSHKNDFWIAYWCHIIGIFIFWPLLLYGLVTDKITKGEK